jgi:hypothetical protein
MSEQDFDPVNRPQGYVSHPSGIESIELVRHLPFGPGNAIKYVIRRGSKGNAEQDLDKAIWYLTDAIEHGTTYLLSRERISKAVLLVTAEPDPYVSQFFTEMLLPSRDRAAIAPRLKGAGSFTASRNILQRLREQGPL